MLSLLKNGAWWAFAGEPYSYVLQRCTAKTKINASDFSQQKMLCLTACLIHYYATKRQVSFSDLLNQFPISYRSKLPTVINDFFNLLYWYWDLKKTNWYSTKKKKNIADVKNGAVAFLFVKPWFLPCENMMISRRLEEHPPHPFLPFVTVRRHFSVKITWWYHVAFFINAQFLLIKDQSRNN